MKIRFYYSCSCVFDDYLKHALQMTPQLLDTANNKNLGQGKLIIDSAVEVLSEPMHLSINLVVCQLLMTLLK